MITADPSKKLQEALHLRLLRGRGCGADRAHERGPLSRDRSVERRARAVVGPDTAATYTTVSEGTAENDRANMGLTTRSFVLGPPLGGPKVSADRACQKMPSERESIEYDILVANLGTAGVGSTRRPCSYTTARGTGGRSGTGRRRRGRT